MFGYQSRMANLAAALALVLALVVVLFPFAWVFLESLKPPDLAGRPELRAFAPTAQHWSDVIGSDVPSNIANSFAVAAVTVAIALAVGCPAAYAFSRYRDIRRLRYAILAATMLPPAILILPFFLLLYQMAMIDTRTGVVLAHLSFVVPVVTWFLIGFFDEVPRELEQQAMIDGCTRMQAFRRVILPNVRPGIGAAAIFGFVLSWNDLFYALLLTGGDSRTLPVAIAGFWTFRGIDLGKTAAAIMLAIGPVLILSFLVQKHLVRGLGGGALKS